MSELFGNVIFSYSRAQALDDGVLINLSHEARQAGFSIPFAITRAVYEAFVGNDPEDPDRTPEGRTLEIAVETCEAVRNADAYQRSCNSLVFNACLSRLGSKVHENVKLKLLIGPGDQGEPVATLMFPFED
jgi:hypothetical protein